MADLSGPELTRGAAMPRLAVLIAAYNAQEGLTDSLRSLDAQAVPFDVFVVDDGSQPPLNVDPGDYIHRVELQRMRHNVGPSEARNVALRRIFTEGYGYAAVLDAGDVDIDDRLTRQMAFLESHRDIALVGAWAQHVDQTGKTLFTFKAPIRPRQVRRRLRYGMAFVHPTCMFRVSALRTVGFYTEDYPVAEDYEIVYRLADRYDTANLPRVLLIKGEDPFGQSIGKRRQLLCSCIRVQLRYFSFLDLHSYLGIVYSLAISMFPYGLLVWLKTLSKEAR